MNKHLQIKNNFVLKLFLLLLFVTTGLTKANAQNYSFKNGSLYYLITNQNNRTVKVVCPDAVYCWQNYTKPTGSVTIPSTVTNTVSEGGGTSTYTYTVTSIGDYAFAQCSGITALSIPNTVTQIGAHAFHYCTGLGTVSIGTNVTNLGQYAFNQCTSLTSATIPSSVTSMGDGCFANCTSLSSVTFNNSPTSIPDQMFYACGNLTTINIPSSVTSIGAGAFCNCSGLTSMTLNRATPPSVHIGSGTGYNASSFEGVTKSIPIHVPCGTTHSYQAATGWNEFTNFQEDGTCPIDFADANVKAICVANWDTNNDGDLSFAEAAAVTSLGTVFKGNTTITSFDELVYFTGVTTIANYAFQNCTSLTSVVIPSFVTSIGDYAFAQCSGFTGTLAIPNTVTTIGDYAFSGCSGISEVHINAINCDGYRIFNGCTSLTSISFGESVASIDPRFKGYTQNLTQITVVSGNAVYDSRNDCNAVINTSTNTLVAGIRSSTIPNTVTAIGDHAFYSCTGLASLELLNSVTSIGEYAYACCYDLTSVTLGGALTTIGRGAFAYCSGLTSVSIGGSVTTIGEDAFNECSALTSVSIGESVSTIGAGAFKCGYDYFTSSYGSLTSVIMLGATPPTISGVAFNANEPSFHFTFYVPYESIDNYKTAPVWNYDDYKNRIKGWMQTSINGYGNSQGSDHWHFIASPLTTSTAPTAIDDLIAATATEYDLYRFNQAGTNGEWENYKVHNFEFANGQGYLYANKSDVNLMFKGDFNENTMQNVPLSYVSNTHYAGYNLVGNPFPVNAYSSRSYYIMNTAGDAVIAEAISTNEPIAPCTGIIVQAMENEDSPTVTFSTTAPSASNKGNINIALSQQVNRSNANIDNAIVSFNEGSELGKFYFGTQNANIYIPKNGKEYAIVSAEAQGEMPVCFKAAKDGQYTITVNTEEVEMDYLHLIDNIAGTDIDLIANPSYTFNAKGDDYESRFRLVFSANSENEIGNDDFAFISNDQLIITGEGTLEVIDVMGRILVTKRLSTTNSQLPITNFRAGVYVLRLINGENVKTQKIVVK